jgi:hypothetical protein
MTNPKQRKSRLNVGVDLGKCKGQSKSTLIPLVRGSNENARPVIHYYAIYSHLTR